MNSLALILKRAGFSVAMACQKPKPSKKRREKKGTLTNGKSYVLRKGGALK